MSTTWKHTYSSLYQLLRGLKDPVDGTAGKIPLVFILACPDSLLDCFLFSFLLHFLIIVLLFNNQKLTIKQSPCPNHPISASLRMLPLLSHAAMLKTLRSLGQSTEANDMCDEVFKEHNPPNIDTSIDISSKIDIDNDTEITE